MICTCKLHNDWCERCGHYRIGCFEACQRGLHDYCVGGVESDSGG